MFSNFKLIFQYFLDKIKIKWSSIIKAKIDNLDFIQEKLKKLTKSLKIYHQNVSILFNLSLL